MRCSKCVELSIEKAHASHKCGAKFSPKCGSCGAENRTDAKFCDSCGAAFGADATVATPAAKMNDTPIRVIETRTAENLEGERKTVTALFADIKGSTELQQDLDPEGSPRNYRPGAENNDRRCPPLWWLRAEYRRRRLRTRCTRSARGPSQRALHAALGMQQEIRRYGDRLLEAGGVPLEICVGVNTGEVVMRPLKTGDSHTEYAPIGHKPRFTDAGGREDWLGSGQRGDAQTGRGILPA